MSLYNGEASIVCLSDRLSVRLSVCKLLRKSLLLPGKLSQDGLQVIVHPGCAQGQRSRDTGTFVLARKSFLLPGKWPDATRLAHDGLQVSLHPGHAQGQDQGQRSRDTGTFVLARKSLLLPGKWPDRDQTCTRWSPGKPASTLCSRSRSRSKVTWYANFLGFLEWATPSMTVWFKLGQSQNIRLSHDIIAINFRQFPYFVQLLKARRAGPIWTPVFAHNYY